IGGFFAKEVVEVRAEPVGAPGMGVMAAFDQLLAAAEAEDRPTSPDDRDGGAVDLPTSAPRTSSAPSRFATVDRSAVRMTEVGLPRQLAEAVDALDPADDLAHLQALSAALAPVCGPLPPGPARLVGDRAERLRGAVELLESEDGHLHLVVGD